MGEYTRLSGPMTNLMKALRHHEDLKESMGIHALGYDRFAEIVMFLETIAYESSHVEFLWGYLKDLGILVEINGASYIDVERFFRFCRLHHVTVGKEDDPLEFPSPGLRKAAETGNRMAKLKEGVAEGRIAPEDAVFSLISSAGRMGMSYNRVYRLAHDLSIEFGDIPDILLSLFGRGRIVRTEDNFFKAVNFEMTVPSAR